MATPLPKVTDSGPGISDLTSLLQLISNNAGTGKATSTETSTTAPSGDAIAKSNELLAQILGQNDPKNMQAMVDNILTEAQQKFGPNLINSIGAGNRALSDTTLARLQAEAIARATGEASGAVLAATNKNNALATQLVDTQVQASKVQTATKTSQTSATPLGKAAGLAGIASLGLSGISMLKKLGILPKELGDIFSGDGTTIADNLVAAGANDLGGSGAGTAGGTGASVAEADAASINAALSSGGDSTINAGISQDALDSFFGVDSTTPVAGATEGASTALTYAGDTSLVDAANGDFVPADTTINVTDIGPDTSLPIAGGAPLIPPVTPPGSFLSTDVNDLYQGGNVVVGDKVAALDTGTVSDVSSGLYSMPPATSDLVDLATTDLAGTGGTAASGVAAEGAGVGIAAGAAGSIFAFPVMFALMDYLGANSETNYSYENEQQKARQAYAASNGGSMDGYDEYQQGEIAKLQAPIDSLAVYGSTNAGG